MITIEIIEDCKKGKHKAQKKLFDFFANHMFNVCMRYLNNTEEAEDVVSQGFAKVFKSIKDMEYRDVNSLRAWMKKIMVNESLMQLRKSVNFSMVSISEADDLSYEDYNLEKMNVQYILAALDELPAGYKTVMNLYVIEGYSHAEIALMLGINESTSRSQLSKARSMMKEKLRNERENYDQRNI